MILECKNYQIQLWEDDTYSLDSMDNLNTYQYVYSEVEDSYKYYNAAIQVMENDKILSSAIICVHGPFTGIYTDSVYVEHNVLWVLAGKWMYCLQVPTLRVIWFKELDSIANFSLYRLEDDFLIRGELEVIRITPKGLIKWRFGGRDIWINLSGRKEVTIDRNMIHLVDFENNEYTIDFEGKEIYSK